MTTAQLNGFLPSAFTADERLRFPVGAPPPGIMAASRRTVEIADARALQAAEALSEAAFFARHSFVLLPHATAVRDWDHDGAIYLPEIEQIVRERLLPGRRVLIHQMPQVMRRGRGTPTPLYADGVHSDGGLGAEDYAHNISAFAGPEAADGWRTLYARNDVEGVVWIDFWRPTNMSGPLEHMPLAVCDAASLEADDLVPTGLTGIAPEGRETHHLSLRFNPGQRWFYYPRMTGDELLAFKLAEFWKQPSPPRNCFHSAFHHPATPQDAQERQSCEHRVSVMVLKD